MNSVFPSLLENLKVRSAAGQPSRAVIRVAASIAGFGAFLWTATAAYAETGRDLVEEHCVECHVREGFTLPGEPPTLPEMARRRVWPGGELKAWLATDHARIPVPRLTSREFYEIEQYLDSLSREFPEF